MTAIAKLSDRLHPILVRDVKQAVRGRVYTVAMIIACISILTIGLLAVDRDHEAIELSRWTLVTTLRCLAPLVLFAIPLMAFLSLREEVTEHTADQLILTGMRPFSVITGMLLAAFAQSLLFVAMFVPLLGFSYLLLGVDILTLLQTVWLALLASMLATSIAFALIRLRRLRQLREHAALLVVVALGWITYEVIARSDALVDWMQANARADDFWLRALQQMTLLGLATVFCSLIGAGSLTHIQENRATSFRILGVVAAPTFTLYFGAGMQGAAYACAGLAPFWFAAVTDPLGLSPRHRPLVPNDKKQALRMLPFLPGSGRGLIYAVLLAAVTFISGVVTHIVFRGHVPGSTDLLFGLVGCEYLLAYAGAFCWMRNHSFEQHRMTTSIARLRLPGITILAWLALGMLDGMASLAAERPMFLLSAANPLLTWTLPPMAMPLPFIAIVLAALIAWIGRANLAAIKASIHEVLTGEPPVVSSTAPWRKRRRRREPR